MQTAPILTGLTLLFLLAGKGFEEYHKRIYKRHLETLAEAHQREDKEAIRQELISFQNDPRQKWVLRFAGAMMTLSLALAGVTLAVIFEIPAV